MSIPSKTWTTPCNFPRKLPSSHQLVLLLHTQRRVCLAGVWAVDIWGMEVIDTVWEEVCKEECFQCLLKSSSDVLKSLPICHRNTLSMWRGSIPCVWRGMVQRRCFSHLEASLVFKNGTFQHVGRFLVSENPGLKHWDSKTYEKIFGQNWQKAFLVMGCFCTFQNHHFLGGVFLDRLRKESKESWTLHPAWDPPPAPEPLQPVATLRSRTSDINLWKNIRYGICIWVYMGTICRYDPICQLKCLSKDWERIETTQRISKDYLILYLSDMVQPDWEIQSVSFHFYFCHS